MQGLILNFLSLIVVFLIGYGLRRIGVLHQKDGNTILRLIFYIGAPALIITTVPTIPLSTDTLWFAVVPLIVSVIMLLSVLLLRRRFLKRIPRKTFGALLAGVMIINTGILIPIIEVFYGVEGLGRLMIVDTMNGVVTFSLIYTAMLLFSGKKPSYRAITEKILAAPAVWALLIALLFSFTNTVLPRVIEIPLEFAAGLVGPLILLALGTKFSLTLRYKLLTAAGLAVRFLMGGLAGLLVVVIAGLSGLDAHIVILAAMAPVGFNAIVFSEKEKFQTDYAASLVSVGIIVAAILIPVVIYSLNLVFPL